MRTVDHEFIIRHTSEGLQNEKRRKKNIKKYNNKQIKKDQRTAAKILKVLVLYFMQLVKIMQLINSRGILYCTPQFRPLSTKKRKKENKKQ